MYQEKGPSSANDKENEVTPSTKGDVVGAIRGSREVSDDTFTPYRSPRRHPADTLPASGALARQPVATLDTDSEFQQANQSLCTEIDPVHEFLDLSMYNEEETEGIERGSTFRYPSPSEARIDTRQTNQDEGVQTQLSSRNDTTTRQAPVTASWGSLAQTASSSNGGRGTSLTPIQRPTNHPDRLGLLEHGAISRPRNETAFLGQHQS